MKERCCSCDEELSTPPPFNNQTPVVFVKADDHSRQRLFCLGCVTDALLIVCQSGKLVFFDGSTVEFSGQRQIINGELI